MLKTIQIVKIYLNWLELKGSKKINKRLTFNQIIRQVAKYMNKEIK